jgi:hypothetical protein
MSTVEPFVPHPHHAEQIGAADPGPGAPPPAPGTGVAGEEPDRVDAEPRDDPDPHEVDTPFRTPEVER